VAAIEIVQARYDDPLAQRLVLAALGDLAGRYGGPGDGTPVDPAEFQPPDGAFLIALLDGEPVACAGWRSHGPDGDVAELKRMFTLPTVRGRGLARRLLAAVEESARSYGRKRLILETGDRQPEAVGLYRSSGYERIPDFGYYRDEDGVMSFGRDL
jgi:GNAT superfamily N-acetyltransferase